jgi:hypothetical protein
VYKYRLFLIFSKFALKKIAGLLINRAFLFTKPLKRAVNGDFWIVKEGKEG